MLDDLYQSLILDHSKRPRNFGPLTEASHEADGFNPLCGDRITVQVILRDGKISQVGFVGDGCAISKASASLMTESVIGKKLEDAKHVFDQFRAMVMGEGEQEADFDEDDLALAKLSALAGVRGFPMRVKCATLAWHTLQAAIARQSTPVNTEA